MPSGPDDPVAPENEADHPAEPPVDSVGLLDTSVFIARESGRSLAAARLPNRSAVSVVTVGELRWGVLMAVDDDTRSRRMDTLASASRLDPVPVDEAVAAAWALLRQQLKAAGARMEIERLMDRGDRDRSCMAGRDPGRRISRRHQRPRGRSASDLSTRDDLDRVAARMPGRLSSRGRSRLPHRHAPASRRSRIRRTSSGMPS